MRRMHFGFLAASLPVLALSLALVGCGGTDTYAFPGIKTTDGKTTEPKPRGEVDRTRQGRHHRQGDVEGHRARR